jgi:hypothetical protein
MTAEQEKLIQQMENADWFFTDDVRNARDFCELWGYELKITGFQKQGNQCKYIGADGESKGNYRYELLAEINRTHFHCIAVNYEKVENMFDKEWCRENFFSSDFNERPKTLNEKFMDVLNET